MFRAVLVYVGFRFVTFCWFCSGIACNVLNDTLCGMVFSTEILRMSGNWMGFVEKFEEAPWLLAFEGGFLCSFLFVLQLLFVVCINAYLKQTFA